MSTQGNAKLLQQLKSGFKRTINWNKYHSKSKQYNRNPHLDHLIDPSFQGVSILFVLSFENDADRTAHTVYYLPKVKIKYCNVKIDGRNFFDQPINDNIKTYENIRIIATGIGDDYTTGCLLDYLYFKQHLYLIAIYISKQQALDADPRAIQQINFTGNLDRAENAFMFFIIEETKETILYFS